MLLRLEHTTSLTYAEPITESVMELRMAPRQEQDQRRLSFTLGIGPPAQVSSYFDWLGNTVHAFTVNPPHPGIRIVATSVVETHRPPADPRAIPDTWPVRVEGYAALDYLWFGGPVVDSPALRRLADGLSLRPGVGAGVLAVRMLDLIHDTFEYRKGITTAASPITDVLEAGAGVCQDFTHLMVGLARACGIPARYVSGLVHAPAAGAFRGNTQTHAWVDLYFPTRGWVGFDPTNNCVVGENFVTVAVGRDYRDVPPNRGVYRGSAKEQIDVAVRTEALAAIPPGLVGERIDRLPVETRAPRAVALREGIDHQPEVQQQQQQQ